MNKSQRIYLNTGDTGNQNQDKYIKVKLEQDVETLEFMSLKIGTADVYQNFNADYGVLVGKVTANNGIGISNAKISIFIPLEDEDKTNSDIYSIYPYDTPRTKNNEGKRYNLLPRVATKDPDTDLISPKQPFGSFPTKEEIVGNEPFLDVYKKYYKYTAKTNPSGDYMIFGLSIGLQTVHMSVDITDIGIYSMSPLSMVNNLGYSENLFSEDKTEIKPQKDLDDLPNIETQEIAVEIVPFWGDTENFEIGITRQDFRIRADLVNTFVIFGSSFTDNADSMWTRNTDDERNYPRELYSITKEIYTGIASKRTGKLTEKIYYYPNSMSDTAIDNKTFGPDDMVLLDRSEYVRHELEGNFVYLIKANRNKFIQDESGAEIPVPDGYDGGLYSDFRGFITFEMTKDDAPMNLKNVKIGQKAGNDFHANPFRYKFKFPQASGVGQSFNEDEGTNTDVWRRDDFIFKSGEIYTVGKFHGITYNKTSGFEDFHQNTGTNYVNSDTVNNLNKAHNWNVGVISTSDNILDGNSSYQFPSNGKGSDSDDSVFGSNWLNFSIYFPQVGYSDESGRYKENDKYIWVWNGFIWIEVFNPNYNDGLGVFAGMYSNTNFSAEFKTKHFYTNNTQKIAGDYENTKWFARSDLHYTTFINVDKSLIRKIDNETNAIKGFTSSQLSLELETLIGDSNFKNGNSPCPTNGGANNGIPGTGTDSNYYFYKGIGTVDCIEYLISLGLV